MRHRMLFAIVLILALLAVSCTSLQVPTENPASATAAATPAAGVAVAPAPTAPAATTIPVINQPAPSTPAPTPSPAATVAPASDATAAIQAVIQRANEAQQQALASGDPTVMRENALSQYYDELVQTNQDLAQGGVTAIKLAKLEWGEIKVTGNSAQANVYETWQTTYDDGRLRAEPRP